MPITLDGTNGITTPMYNGSITANAVTPSVNMKNRIINGAMVIDQRNAGASVTQTTSAPYTLDRWYAFGSVNSKFTVQQDAGTVTPPAGFTDYLGATSSSAYSVGSSEQYNIAQVIEGFNIADLGWGTANAKTVTLSFWVRSSLTGTFGGSLRNVGTAYSYPFSYTISSANTWEYETITIAGSTAGTWGSTNGVGIYVNFSMGAGSTLSGTAGSWSANNFTSSTGATSVVGTNGATFYITGVQLEVGSTATSFDYRPYGTELALCQRYYFDVGGYAYSTASIGGTAYSTTWCYGLVQSPVTMRAMPTFAKIGTWNWNDYVNAGINTNALTFTSNNSTLNAFWVASHGTASGLTEYRTYNLAASNDATARLTFSAEL
jgi:hypothetical protein